MWLHLNFMRKCFLALKLRTYKFSCEVSFTSCRVASILPLLDISAIGFDEEVSCGYI